MHSLKQTHSLPGKSTADTYASGTFNQSYSLPYGCHDEGEPNKHLDYSETTMETMFA